jgi:transcriptional regulator with PAS, ATPase and Fis domain
VGGNENIKIDVRIVAATNRNLEEAVKKGTFREDLYYRLNVILLETPPLRTRTGDVEELALVFLKRFSERYRLNREGFTPEALEVILAHRWPGNIRELENVMERVCTLESGPLIQVTTLPPEMVLAARKEQGKARELVLRADFSLGPVELEPVLQQVREFYQREAAVFAKGNAELASKLVV